jgi:hypothetical protein
MSSIRLGSSGRVYALVSASQEGLVKIGATTLDPKERARQLSAATAAATPFHVVYSRPTNDVTTAEAQVHALLSEFRVNDGREFFAVSVAQAIAAIDQVCGVQDRLPATPFAELFASFPDDGSPRPLTEQEQEQCRALEAREQEIAQDGLAARTLREEGWISRSLRRISRRRLAAAMDAEY